MARDRDKEERNERAKKAIGAMKAMGIPVHKAKPVLKSLLKESENSWDFIEADNYSVLVDALISLPESPVKSFVSIHFTLTFCCALCLGPTIFYVCIRMPVLRSAMLV